jgi:phosphoglycolate phosphatase-like HAD superfamily hydrolase
MDGVLVDVSKSYRDTVRQTTAAFLQPAAGSESLPRPLFRLADLAALKQSGGLNNDWDLTHRVLSLLFTQVACEKPIHEQNGWQFYEEEIRKCDVRRLAAFLKETDRPLQKLMQPDGQAQNRFVDQMYQGDVGSGNIIKQMFQEIYLGRDLFQQTYGSACRVHSEEGFIHRETLFAKQGELEILSQGNLLAIATGRPRAEANYPLTRFGLTKYFRTVLTLDDCLEAQRRHQERTGEEISLGKPHPFMLDAVAAAIQEPVAARVYVGDMPDDMQAAGRSQAGYIGIGMAISAADRALLRERLIGAGAAHVVDDFAELLETLDKIN